MDPRLPYLDIRGPEFSPVQYQLTDQRVSVGRLSEHNEVVLEPDPQQLVSRVSHCLIEREGGTWWVVDGGSRNRTFLQVGKDVDVVAGRSPLADGSIICILARLPEDEQTAPDYWYLTFRDPASTRAAIDAPAVLYLQYDWAEARLYRVSAERIIEIDNLRPQEHQLIRYMDQRNRDGGYVAAMCGHDELIEALWGDDGYDHTEAEIARIVWGLRQKIEPDAGDPQLLQTVRGLGYRLITRPHGSSQ